VFCDNLIEKAIKIKQKVDNYTTNNHFKIITDGVLRYIPNEIDEEIIAVCFTGRNCNPEVKTEGMHMTAALYSSLGLSSFISSAHNSSRRMTKSLVIQEIEKYKETPNIFVFGHSHGADHASVFSNELYKDTGLKTTMLHTIDPVNSPWPFPLTKINNVGAINYHINYYQRNFLFFGGNIKTANEIYNVSDYSKWPSLSKLIIDRTNKKPKITHCTIDLDMLLNGKLIEGVFNA
jgi:hypothetical protein